MTVTDWSDAVIYFVVVVARLVVPLGIPRYPLPAISAALALDAADQTIFQATSDIDLAGYQTYDKALDVYYLTIAYASTIRNWDLGHAFVIGRFLWYYRLVGVVAFEYAEARWLLFVFPNTFEYYFVAIEALKTARNPFTWTRRQFVLLAAAIWIGIKLPQEWWLHVAERDVTDTIKEHLFGVDLTDSWATAIANRPLVLLVLVGGAVGLVVAVARIERLLPPRDWPPTFSADEQGRHLGWATPSEESVPAAFFGWSFVEKAALVTLVTLIFGQILPGADDSVVRVATATTLVIAVSTLVSQWLARHEVTWRSAGAELVVMGAANTAIGFGVQRFLPGGDRVPPIPTFLFLIGLLTLIVVLFDRFKQIARHPSRRRWRLREAARVLAGRAP